MHIYKYLAVVETGSAVYYNVEANCCCIAQNLEDCHLAEKQVGIYPEPAFISAIVRPALLLPLSPLYQTGTVVSGQADVTAASRGADSSPDDSWEEGLCA